VLIYLLHEKVIWLCNSYYL